MELQFDRALISCLQNVVNETQSQELTQEVKLNESMPDVGRVIGAWGQCLLRSKEWNRGEICATGGVMAWVLYAPEDGGTVQCVETWLPFQSKCSFEDPGKDGSIHVRMLLHSVEARSTAARKLMIRANIDMRLAAVVKQDSEVFLPSEVPQDVQLLINEYPLRLPKEAGEKSFLLDEELTIPNASQQVDKLIRYELRPEIIDRKVVAGKAVFRGAAILHILYTSEGGEICSWDFDVPFSQYTDLDGIYDDDAEAEFCFAVTSLDLEKGEPGVLRLKAGIIGQYMIYGREVIRIVEDAYSPIRTVGFYETDLKLPMMLDNFCRTLKMEQPADIPESRILDISFQLCKPLLRRDADSGQIGIPGVFQVLYCDQNGDVKITTTKANLQHETLGDGASDVSAFVSTSGKPYCSFSSGSALFCSDIILDVHTTAIRGMCMLSGLELGDTATPSETRPSMILRRVGDDTLWDIAKQTGSTVEMIKIINQIQENPDPERMLLVPVL